MAKIIEVYNPQKIEIVKRMLDKQSEKGSPMAYEVFVDNFKVVMKTTDLSEFDSYEDIMNNDTKFIRINVYNTLTETVGHTKYVFEVEGLRKSDEQKPLGEVTMDIDSKIKESIAAERERWDKDQLTKELDHTKLSLQEAEEYIDELQTQIERAKLKPNYWGKIDLGMLAGTALEGIMRKNPHWVKKAGFETLAGVIEKENSEGIKSIETATEETEASFTKSTDAPALTKEQQEYINFGNHLAENFDEDEMLLLDKIIMALSKDTSKLKIVADLLNAHAE